MVRRAEDTDDTGALSRGARPTWAVLVLIAAILTAGGAVLAAERAVATVVAQEVVAPVARKLDDHLASSAALRVVMDRYVEEQREVNRLNSQRLDALCRANPHANCPLSQR